MNAVHADNEVDYLTCISKEPNRRVNFVRAAEYFDSTGDSTTASSLHNGVVPDWLVEKYNLSCFNSMASSKSAKCQRISWSPAHSEVLVPVLNNDDHRNRVFHAAEKKCLSEEVCCLLYTSPSPRDRG